ncbi:hypothetical protein HQ544_01800 [Candidatus Falkowbacteria bacterium]|nr:hypothetical protein [Candidatus Falkowbacteria bacterium]
MDFNVEITQEINDLTRRIAIFLNFGKSSLEYKRYLIPKKFQDYNLNNPL